VDVNHLNNLRPVLSSLHWLPVSSSDDFNPVGNWTERHRKTKRSTENRGGQKERGKRNSDRETEWVEPDLSCFVPAEHFLLETLAQFCPL